jgi:hypothetical protein
MLKKLSFLFDLNIKYVLKYVETLKIDWFPGQVNKVSENSEKSTNFEFIFEFSNQAFLLNLLTEN